MNTRKFVTTGIAGLALCAVGLLASPSAMAATATHPNRAPRAGSRPSPKQITEGFNVYNDSAETLVYNDYIGDVHTPPTTPRVPGSKTNYEISASYIKKYTGTMNYFIDNPEGQTIGSLAIFMDDDGDSAATFYNNDGTLMTTMTAEGTGGDGDGQTIYIEDAKGSPASNTVFTPGSAEEQATLTDICQTNPKQCKFTATGETETSTKVLLADAYNGDTKNDSQLSANNGYTAGTTDQWGVAVTAGAKILDTVDLSVQASYSHQISTSTSFGTSYQISVDPGTTGYIYASIPMYLDSGTWTITLGNTKWTMPGVSYTNPDPKGVISYTNTAANGDVPIPVTPNSGS